MSRKEKLPDYEYDKVPTKEIIKEKEEVSKYGLGIRHIQVAIIFFCLTVNMIGRAHIGVTIVAMTSNASENTGTANTTLLVSRDNDTNNFGEGLNITDVLEDYTGPQTYIWPKYIQEMVLNAFFLGYTIMMFPMGMVCQRYGGKLPLQISFFINAVTSIITPWLTYWADWKAVCACRIIQGFSQAGTFPCTHALLAAWVPTNERGTLSAYVFSGMTIGTIVSYQLAGFLGASSWGWPSTFYVVGAICFVCFVLLTAFGASSPNEHKSVSEEEKRYIMTAGNDGNSKKLKTPWRAILTSKPYWGTVITQIGGIVAYVFFFNQVPSYVHHIHGVNVRNSGLLSSLPYIAGTFTTLAFGWLSDYCTNKNILTRRNARIICNSVGHFGIAIPLVLTSYTSNTTVAVTFLVIAMGAYSAENSGWTINYIDLAPNFSGIIMAAANTLGNIFIVLTPVLVSFVITDMTNITQWRIIFFIMAGVAIITNAAFVLLASTEIQPWNNPDYNESCIETQTEDLKTDETEKLERTRL